MFMSKPMKLNRIFLMRASHEENSYLDSSGTFHITMLFRLERFSRLSIFLASSSRQLWCALAAKLFLTSLTLEFTNSSNFFKSLIAFLRVFDFSLTASVYAECHYGGSDSQQLAHPFLPPGNEFGQQVLSHLFLSPLLLLCLSWNINFYSYWSKKLTQAIEPGNARLTQSELQKQKIEKKGPYLDDIFYAIVYLGTQLKGPITITGSFSCF